MDTTIFSVTTTASWTDSMFSSDHDVPYTATATPVQKAELKLYDILMPILGLLVIGLNGAVVISSGLILKRGQQAKSTYLFLGNLAMTDLVTAIAIIFGQFYPKSARTVPICAMQIGLIVSSTLASVYSVGLIAIDRYLYIVHGLKYQQWVYPTRARCWILCTWIIGFVIGFLPLFGWHGDTQNGKVCWFIKLAPKYLILTTVIIGVVPMVTVVILYAQILYRAIEKIVHIQRSVADACDNTNTATTATGKSELRMFKGGAASRKPSGDGKLGGAAPVGVGAAARALDEPSGAGVKVGGSHGDSGGSDSTVDIANGSATVAASPSVVQQRQKTNVPSKWKAIKVVIFTSGSFLITWGPYFVVSLMYTYSCVDAEDRVLNTDGAANVTSLASDLAVRRCKNLSFAIASPLAILGFANSLINPVIYAWWHKGFREYVRRIWHSFRRRRRDGSMDDGRSKKWRRNDGGDAITGVGIKGGRKATITSTTSATSSTSTSNLDVNAETSVSST